MWNGNAVPLVAASLLFIAGCDGGPTARETATTASVPPQVESANGRYRVDRDRNRVWFLTHEGVSLYDPSQPQRIELSLPGWTWAGAPHGCLPDLALGPRGEAVITSDVLPTLWRIDPETLAVSVHPLTLDSDNDKDVGFSALVYSAERGAFFAASYHHGSLWRVDPLLTRAQRVPLSAPVAHACEVTVRARNPQRGSWLAGLCVRTPDGGWSVDFAPDQRFAYVRPASCTDRPGVMQALSLKGD
ncbi:MAG TPA: hypothetical protein VGX52_12685 [Burkholderiales bacterium]|nr:hypothetical protein [Burkholderiales bacterium]